MQALLLALAIAVQGGNNMPLVEGCVDGEKCTLLLDTGASHTTLDLAFVTNRLAGVKLEEVQLVGATNVATPPKFAAVSSLELGEEKLEIEGVMAVDLSHLSSAVGRRVDGILGMNHLRRRRCLISLAKGELKWEPSEEEKLGFHRVLTRDRGTTFELIVKLPSGEIMPLLIDTGSSFTFINRDYWKASEENVHLAAADVNASASMGFVRGEKGTLDCGKGFKIEVSPILTEERNRNQIGSDVFLAHDLLIEGNRVSVR